MNIIVYVMDSLRPDFLGCYGYLEPTSPNIDQFAKDSILFTQAYSTSSWTKPALASFLTSQYPRSLNMLHLMSEMPDCKTTLQKVLHETGYSTYCISTNHFLLPEFGFKYFDQLIDLVRTKTLPPIKKRRFRRITGKGTRKKLGIDGFSVPHSEDINEVFFKILDNDNSANNFFLIWAMDTHSPYFVRGDNSYFGNSLDDFIPFSRYYMGSAQKLRSLYCDMIHYNDYHIGKLIERLKARNVYDDSLIIIAGDHGEAFGEHRLGPVKLLGHWGEVYEERIRVPLVIKFPKNKYAGSRIHELVQITDIYPTVLDVCQIKFDEQEIEGISLLPDKLRAVKDRSVFIECCNGPRDFCTAAIRKDSYKLIKFEIPFCYRLNPRKLAGFILRRICLPPLQLYNLKSDPCESNDLYNKRQAISQELVEEYNQVKNKCDEKSSRFKVEGKADVDEEIKEHLRALGYMD
jgi:arylsulfatase